MASKYAVIVHLGGLLHSVVPYDDLEKAQYSADDEAQERDPDEDEVVVWDLKKNDVVYDAFEEEEPED